MLNYIEEHYLTEKTEEKKEERMSRIPFSQVLKNAHVDIRKEYDRLYNMFYCGDVTLKQFCENHFMEIPVRGRCTSLNDFDHTYNFNFQEYEGEIDYDYLISFCEYSYNLLNHFEQKKSFVDLTVKNYLRQVEKVIEAIGYMANKKGNVTDFVPKDQAAISVAEIIDPNLSYKVIEYNHYSMKGDLERKKTILLALADKLEPMNKKDSDLEKIDKALKSDLFSLINNMNIRHNNVDKNGKAYKEFVANMSKDELENWYDEIYQMCLLAFLELEHLKRKACIKELEKICKIKV